MKKTKIHLLALLSLLMMQCAQKKEVSDPTSFRSMVTLYSSTYQSAKAPIIVQFVDDAVDKPNIKADQSIFSITPKVEGNLIWQSKNLLSFIPKEKLEAGKNYMVTVKLDEIYKNVPDSLSEFNFEVQTIEQHFSLGGTYLTPIRDSLFTISGNIQSSDLISSDELTKIFSAQLGNEKVKIKWRLKDQNKRTHSFYIDSIQRKDDHQELLLSINSSSNCESKIVNIPAFGDFKLVDTELIQNGNQQIKLLFSDVINQDQELAGILQISEPSHEVTIEDNYILIDFKNEIDYPIDIKLASNFVSVKNHKLQEKVDRTFEFEPVKPGVRLVESKTIYPYQNVLPLSLETVNLNAIDIRVTKVYQNNILQFLAQNQLNENYNLRYVGDVVIEKKIELSNKQNLNLWNKQTIDLKPLIKKDPGALYHVEVGFRRSYSTFNCKEMENENYDPSTIGFTQNIKLTEENFWDQKDAYEHYDWREKENPCHSMYYREDYYSTNKTISTNVLGSNLGMIAKQEKNGNLLVFVNSISTALPIGNAKVDVYSKNNQKLKTVYTNQQGVAKITGINQPFLAVSSYGKQKGYLELDYSELLSLSMFDVDGSYKSQNVKGFLYAERGVWRPGDSIFLNLIIEDKDNNLPSNYPIGFEFINPDGLVIERRTTTKGLNGHYKFWTKTDIEDQTGNYFVNAYVGENVYSKTIKVETIRPNRLKMNLSFGKDDQLFTSKPFTTEIETKWLHGAPGKDLKHKVDVTLSRTSTSFNNFANYSFSAPYREFSSSDFVFMEKKTNQNGKIIAKQKFKPFKNAPGFLRAKFTVKAFEKGGRFSIDETSKIVHPYKNYVGISIDRNDPYYEFNKTYKKQLVNLDYNGNPTDDKLIIKLYKVDYDWWYDLNDNNTYNYKGELNKKTISKDTIQTIGGKAIYPLILTKDLDEGKYLLLIKNSEGHVTGEEMYFYQHDYYSQPAETEIRGTAELSLTTNKDFYESGQWAELTIPTQNKGRVLISIEDGQKIISTKWVKVTSKNTKYKFRIGNNTPSYIYANVLYIQPHNTKKNDLPLRMYGVIPIHIKAKNSKLNPIITMANELKPKQNYTVKIKEEKNLPMTYTLAVVDEGLLDITHYHTPNIWRVFNHKPALEVKTWDFYDRIVNKENFYTKNLLSIGGDGGYEENKVPEGIKLNRFKPVVKFIGPFYCPPGQTKTHQLKMENYVGAVRVMVVAGHNGAYGKNEKTIQVKNPLMVIGTMPRVLGPNEEISLPVDVFAMEKHIKNVKISLETNDLLTIANETKKNLTFNKIENQQVFFKLKTKEKFGVAKLNITAKSGNEIANYQIELLVRPSNDYLSVPHQLTLQPGTTFDKQFTSFGYHGTNSLSLEVSSIPAINLEKRLGYLISYPYGCVEQTTSSIFPQLFLSDIMDLDFDKKRKIEKNINAGISRLKRFQTDEGGFGYWPGDYENHEWATNYVGHFLLEAKNKGFNVSEELLKKWTHFQNKKANEWSVGRNNLSQNYRLYLLAKSGSPNIGAMNRMRLNIKNQDLGLWYLAACYQIIGKNSVTQELIKKAPTFLDKNKTDIYSFGSVDRDNAIILQMMNELNLKDKAWKLTKHIAEKLNKNTYLSTQTTAYCLLAVSSYAQTYDSKEMSFATNFPNQKAVKTNKCLWQETIKYNGSKIIKMSNSSKQPLFVTVIQKGIPKNKKDTLVEAKGIALFIKYKTPAGSIVKPQLIKQGEDIVVEIQAYNGTKKVQRHLSLTQIVPSGWEILNTSLFGGSSWKNKVNREEIRDDRVNLFYNLMSGETKKFKIHLNASYVGKFYLPAIQSQAMYDHEIRARKPGFWVSVER